MTNFGQDLRDAVRTLRRSPGFSAVAILTLALGIGANTAIFGLVEAVVLRPLPVRHPADLIVFRWAAKSWPGNVVDDVEGSSFSDPETSRQSSEVFSLAMVNDLRMNASAFASVGAVAANEAPVNLGNGRRAESGTAQFVSGDFFSTLGLTSWKGRLIAPPDDDVSAPPVAVASQALWSRWFADRPATSEFPTLAVNGIAVPVVGVAPTGFFGLDPTIKADLWLPLRAAGRITHSPADFADYFSNRRTWWLRPIARLRAGASRQRAFAQAKTIFERTLERKPGSAATPAPPPSLSIISAARGTDDLRRQLLTPINVLSAIVVLLLALTCANVSGLMLARSLAHQKSVAIRASLGAGTTRLVRAALAESLLLSLAASALAFFTARAVAAGLLAVFETGTVPIGPAPQLNATATAFALTCAIVTTVATGLVPALRSAKLSPATALKSGASNAFDSRAHRLPRDLVRAQAALAVVLLAGAGLFVRTLQNLNGIRTGFADDRILLLRVRPGINGYDDARLLRFYESLRVRFASIPGVLSATLSHNALVGDGLSTNTVRFDGFPETQSIDASRNLVGPEFFKTYGIPILAGRAIGVADRKGAPPVAVVSASVGRKIFGSGNPIGRTVDFGSREHRIRFEIVGVSADAVYHDIRNTAPLTIFLPYTQSPFIPGDVTFELRSHASPELLVAEARRVLASLDPDLPVARIETQRQAIRRVLGPQKTFAALTSAFGLLGLALAGIGLFGLLAFDVARRRREIAVRVALGAARREVVTLFVREALSSVTLGAVIGLAIVGATSRLIRSQLYGVSPDDPAALFAAVAILIVTALAATIVPARRAAKVDPMVALRSE